MSITFTDANFSQEVLTFKGLVLVDFWAEWCNPCKMQGPAIEKLAEKFASNTSFKVGKLDVDENSDTAMKYSVMSIPTLLFIKDGEVVDMFVGLKSEADIEKKINELLAK